LTSYTGSFEPLVMYLTIFVYVCVQMKKDGVF